MSNTLVTVFINLS